MNDICTYFRAASLAYFTREQMEAVHSASMDILEDTGTVVHHGKAIKLLETAGAYVKNNQQVCIPTALVEWAVRQAPARITLYNRLGQPAMFLEGTNVYFGTGSDVPTLLDSVTGERRDFLLKDVADAVRLVDALPHIDFTMSNGLAPDAPTATQYQHKYAAMIRNSTKPQVITAENQAVLNDIADMAAAVVEGRQELSRKPLFVLYAEPTSPLVHSKEALEKLLFLADNHLPTNYAPGMMAGGTGPVTMAGAIALANAEILTGLVIHNKSLAVDAIKRVGPGGHFLGDAHTFQHFRENWQPDLTDRRTYETWAEDGKTSMGQRAKAKIRDILATHHPEPLSDKANADIDAIIARAQSNSTE